MGKKEFAKLDNYFLEVQKRIVDALNRAGIMSEEALRKKSEDELLAIFGITRQESKSIAASYNLKPSTQNSFSWKLSVKDYNVLNNNFGITNEIAFMMWELAENKKGAKTRRKKLNDLGYKPRDIKRLEENQEAYAKAKGFKSVDDYRKNIQTDQIPISRIFVGKIADVLNSKGITTIGELVEIAESNSQGINGIDDKEAKTIINELKKIGKTIKKRKLKTKPQKSKTKLQKSKTKPNSGSQPQKVELILLDGTSEHTEIALKNAGIECEDDIYMLTRQQLLGIFGVSKKAVDTIESNIEQYGNGEKLRIPENEYSPFQWGEFLNDDYYKLLFDNSINSAKSFMEANNNNFNSCGFNENEKAHFKYVATRRQIYVKRVREIILQNLENARNNNTKAQAARAEAEATIEKYVEALGMLVNDDGELEELS